MSSGGNASRWLEQPPGVEASRVVGPDSPLLRQWQSELARARTGGWRLAERELGPTPTGEPLRLSLPAPSAGTGSPTVLVGADWSLSSTDHDVATCRVAAALGAPACPCFDLDDRFQGVSDRRRAVSA